MCVLSSEYLLIYNAKNRLKIKQDSWWVEFKIFSEQSSQKFVWKKNNEQTSLFNIYLSKANRMCLKTYYCLKLIH